MYEYGWSDRVSSSSIGAYDAKTHLPRLLDQVARGESRATRGTLATLDKPLAKAARKAGVQLLIKL